MSWCNMFPTLQPLKFKSVTCLQFFTRCCTPTSVTLYQATNLSDQKNNWFSNLYWTRHALDTYLKFQYIEKTLKCEHALVMASTPLSEIFWHPFKFRISRFIRELGHYPIVALSHTVPPAKRKAKHTRKCFKVTIKDTHRSVWV